MRLTAAQLAQATGGTWLQGCPTSIESIGTDSRDFEQGSAFLALRGPSFDGHEHASKVCNQASALIGDAVGVPTWASLATPQLQVQDTLHAFGDIAAYYRKQLSACKVIAITGSYGKTTVRSMLAHVLMALGLEVAATKANLNNWIGVPKTLLDVPPTADVALIECGISEIGEMERLSEIVQPDIAVVTGLTQAHTAGLGDLIGIAQEKAKLMQHLSTHGWSMLGKGVADVFAKAACVMPHETYAVEDDSSVTWCLEGRQLALKHAGEVVNIHLALPAQHWAENMALVATLVLKLAENMGKTWTLADIGKALQTWKAVDGRMHVYPATADQPFTLIDDAYNANPVSMQAALNTLAALDGFRIAVLGDMGELGNDAEAYHRGLDLHDIDEVICIGDWMASLAVVHAGTRCFKDVATYIDWLQQQPNPPTQSTILCKASRGMGLDRAVAAWLQRGHHAV